MKHLMKPNISIFTLVLFLLFFACKEEETPTVIDPPANGVPDIAPIEATGDEQYLTLDSDYIFDQEKLPSFELLIPQENLDQINADPAAEEYVEGSLVFEGDTISPVGIRYKGSIGAFVSCVSGNNWAEPSGYKTCTKLSMKVKINWEGREDKFYGLNKLQFHSMNQDDSQMRERLGYWLFREMGVPAPRCVHTRLTINGEYSGLYALVEQIDGRFTRYNFDDGEGNLYKEVWPLHQNGNPHPDGKYFGGLKTNEDESPSIDIIRDFAQNVADAEPQELKEVIEAGMDINEALSYAVVDRTIRHDDGPFHWYCSGNDCSSHNFYWYEEPNNKKLHLITWDLDNAFENIISDANPVTPIHDEWGEISNDCQPFGSGFWGLQQWSATCDKLTAGWATYTDEYEQIKTEFVNGPLSASSVNSRLDTWSNQIESATQEAEDAHGDAVSVTKWQQGMNTLKNQINFARNQ